MNFQFYKEKLMDSEEYKKFVKDNPKAFPCSGFFILDREKDGATNQVCFDFWLPSEEKMFSFRVDKKLELTPVGNFDKRGFEEISLDYDFELEDFEKLILEKIEKEKINGKIHKLLFSLQRLDGKDFFVVTIFLNNLALIKTNIDVEKREITSFEKKSFLDMLKIIKKKDKSEK